MEAGEHEVVVLSEEEEEEQNSQQTGDTPHFSPLTPYEVDLEENPLKCLSVLTRCCLSGSRCGRQRQSGPPVVRRVR